MLSDNLFVPNDTEMNDGNLRMQIITGPNMAGKSTYMRQVALIVLMAHMGSFVPAREAAISLVDNVYTRVGASDDLGGRPIHLHGRNERNGLYPAQRHRPFTGHSG